MSSQPAERMPTRLCARGASAVRGDRTGEARRPPPITRHAPGSPACSPAFLRRRCTRLTTSRAAPAATSSRSARRSITTSTSPSPAASTSSANGEREGAGAVGGGRQSSAGWRASGKHARGALDGAQRRAVRPLVVRACPRSWRGTVQPQSAGAHTKHHSNQTFQRPRYTARGALGRAEVAHDHRGRPHRKHFCQSHAPGLEPSGARKSRMILRSPGPSWQPSTVSAAPPS